jgi:hypothetical protein
VPAEVERCSALSLAFGEPLMGTASTVPNWIMLEHPGPWGPDALKASRLPQEVAEHLRAIDRQFGVRVVLIRRHGRRASEGPLRCFMAHTGPGRPWLEGLTLSGHADLLDFDLSPVDWSVPPGLGEAIAGPLFLVCTHGRRDPCCAERGRPLARGLAAAYEERLWESSHIGGDRFAGNLVCFPHGVYLGRLDSEAGVAAARGYERGTIDLHHYRGRSCYSFPVQAVESLLRRHEGLSGVDDLRLIRTGHPRTNVVEATFEGPGGRRYIESVRIGRAEPPRPLTCHEREPVRPPVYSEL